MNLFICLDVKNIYYEEEISKHEIYHQPRCLEFELQTFVVPTELTIMLNEKTNVLSLRFLKIISG